MQVLGSENLNLKEPYVIVCNHQASLDLMGTRNPNKSMLPFKRGAFHLAVQAQVPIFPIVISPYRDFFSSKEKRFTSGTCTIRVLPKVETQGLSPQDVPRLTESVRQAMADALAEMSVNHHGHQGRGRSSPWCEEDSTGTTN
ncbi:1-acyl-sn-glycerol-3-phosphate acyltransferase alpha-like protein [Willisornis vidua]|uniref:1-acylglycerol-3-phosphate O-acyltransferase n=1 Tax=Willisornis vidua TaxID=1566151 RepID=A0ABQ9DR70_9PASS|nr:1-acyl-sn-glycerol-3-phosphate acyltransferase alpha-like protein [Willisornis vidua]